MTQPTTPRVQTRQLSWKELCQKAWGKDWANPDPSYEFSGGRSFESTDSRQGGPYEPDQGD